jgi:hypothetical protein
MRFSLKPVFIGWLTILSVIPLQLFFTLWAGLFFRGLASFFFRSMSSSWTLSLIGKHPLRAAGVAGSAYSPRSALEDSPAHGR